jgi:uncharacterized membrane protein YphA (DoxX/SURF4 family)
MHLPFPIPLGVVYAGLAGCLLALIVAAATNGWSLRVFLLLALRLAIGWHFLFEGLHKIQSVEVGPTETNRPFTSAPYFAAADGPLGDYMRKKYLGDPVAEIDAKVRPKKAVGPAEFAKLPEDEQAALCPEAAAKDLDQPARAAYARWVYGVDAREAKVGHVSGGTATLTAPSRLAIIELLKKQVADLEARQAVGLGNGYGMDESALKTARSDLRSAETELAADADKFLVELKKADAGATAAEKPIAKLDRMTMWAITAIGACLLAGFLTRPACIAAVGFLVLTYLTHPPFPWLPLPPNTEGNPVFVNKNVIEALALLVIASFPTGKWLGIDSLFYWFLGRGKS